MTTESKPRATRDPWVALGLFVSTLSAAVSSFAGLHALALGTGWHPWAAPLFPLTVDCYAMTSVRVWLARSTQSERARQFARTNAIGAILLSVLGNGSWHLIAAGLVDVTWLVVVLVGAVPPVVLGLVVHLAVLRSQDDGDERRDEPGVREAVPVRDGGEPAASGTVPRPKEAAPKVGAASLAARRYASEDQLLLVARNADLGYRSRYGKPITRDELRRELRISSGRATEIVRKLKQEQAAGSDQGVLTIPQQTST